MTDHISKIQLKKSGFLLQAGPKRFVLGAGPFRPRLHPPPGGEAVFHPPFFLSPRGKYWLKPAGAAVLSQTQLKMFLTEKKAGRGDISCSLKWKEPSKKAFQTVFQLTKEHIQQKKIKKIVPVFFETAPYPFKNSEVFVWLNRLLAARPNGFGFSYAFWGQNKLLIGHTPEVLFHKKGKVVKTMALAGTGQGRDHNLLADPKEQYEHHLTAADIKRSLKPLGALASSAPYIHRIQTLAHLRTDFKLVLKKDISFNLLCRRLHPTPALGGAPKVQALNLLKRLETYTGPRGVFGAPFGIVLKDECFCAAAIRNVQFLNQKVYVGAGCGLVKQSRMSKEWQELKLKREFIKRLLF